MFAAAKTVHIHASQLCNLRCRHCYSVSGPGKHAHLAVDALLAATRQLHDYGYRTIALSGGEPTLYPGFAKLCEGLTRQNYHVSAITNGWRSGELHDLFGAGALQTVGISFDGLRDVHDDVRQRKGSFDRATQTLQAFGGGAGAVVAVTKASLPNLPDLVEHLANAGVAWVQFHPIAQVGRALGQTDYAALSQEALVRLILISQLMASLYPGIRFQCDAMMGKSLPQKSHDLTDEVISPLVIKSNG